VVIPFVFGYFTRKHLTDNYAWISAATLVIPVFPNMAILIYDQIKAGWGPMDVPLSATIGVIFVQAVFAVFGAYVCGKNTHFDAPPT